MILRMLILTIFTIQIILARFHKEHQILVSRFNNESISNQSLIDYKNNIRNEFIENLKKLSQSEKEYLKDNAALEYESYQQTPFSAWLFLEYSRNGNRKNYESIVFENVRRLSVLIVGHLLEELENPKTKIYLDDIFSETYRILELTTWAWPAHVIKLKERTYDFIELGAAEMAKQMAWIKLLMGKKFYKIDSGDINTRITHELENRIFKPYINRYFSWHGLPYPHASANNWNIWINANILKSAFLTLDDANFVNKIFQRSIKSVDVFIDNYGDDGGCEEGSAYWREASGRFSEYLHALSGMFSNSNEYFKTIGLIKKMGDYSWKMRIRDDWFVNFADATPEIVYPPWYLWNYATMFDDQTMRKYSAFMLAQNSSEYLIYSKPLENFKDLNDFVSFVRIKDELEQISPMAPKPEVVLLKDLEVVIGRSKPEFQQFKSLFFAAKMGTNFESHSHNDIGSFILFQGDLPVLIDIGVGVYTSKTFSSKRYTLFYMQSRYHNCPTINGFDQHAGYPFRSNNVDMGNSSSKVHLDGNIESAYPKHAKIRSYHRSVNLDLKRNQLVLNDKYELEQYLGQTSLNFVTTSNMNLVETSYGLHLSNSDGVDMEMHFSWSQFDMEGEYKSFDNDIRLNHVWGDGIKHFTLSTKPEQKLLENDFTIVFKPQ